MNSSELKDVINELRLSQGEFARLVGVSVGAVSQWLSDARSIPGPLEAFVGLFMRLPASMREQELALLKTGVITMRSGMYLIQFTGSDGTGYATLTIHDGRAYGFDTAGCLYDGSVTPAPEGGGIVRLDLKVRMPANVPSVVGGVAHPFEWTLPVSAKMNLGLDQGYVLVDTGLGPKVQATYTRMRDLPMAA